MEENVVQAVAAQENQNFILHAFEAGGPVMFVILGLLILTLIVVIKQLLIHFPFSAERA